MSKSETVATEGEDADGVRIWSQITFKANLGNYENCEISIGTSMAADPDPKVRKRQHRRLHDEHKALIATRIDEVRDLWQND